MKENKWKKLWNGRAVDIAHNDSDDRTLLLELKRSNGFDVVGELNYEVIIEQYEQIKRMLFPHYILDDNVSEGLSIYEVGCRSGKTIKIWLNTCGE